MEVKIISSEIIKPSSPTPSHLQILTLSLLDQKFTPVIVSVLLFYPAPEGAARLDITRLKTCLWETLTSFYPLAGRYQTWGTILCNDEGVHFVEAQVNCPLSDVLSSLSSSSSINLLSFYPPNKEDLLPSGIHLAFQINVFTCGGFAVGLYHTHKVTDGTSAATFFRHWAALVSQRYEDAAQAQPDFSSGAITFPPVTEEKSIPPEFNHKKQEEETKEGEKQEKNESWNLLFNKRIAFRSFVIKNEAVTELKAQSVSEHVANSSRFEAVSGFLWKQIMLASSSKEGRSMLNINVDLRPRTDPPLPKGSMGNLMETVFVLAEKKTQLPELIAEIHGSISKAKDLALEYQGANREEAKNRHTKNFTNGVLECKVKDAYVIAAWCKSAGFSDVDFGFGKPKWIIPVDHVVNHNKTNTIILTEFGDSHGVGFEAWMFIEEQLIKCLESNPEFLAFASPNF